MIIPRCVTKAKYRRSESNGNIGHNQIGKNTLTQVSYYKSGNAGDTVLSKCVRKTFENSMDVNWYLQDVPNIVTKRDIDVFNETKGVIIGGGGLFLPDTNANLVSGWQWAISTELLHAIEKPIIVFSVGYNFFPGQESSQLFCDNLIELVRKAAFVGLRNSGSINSVRALLPEELREKVIYQPCTTTLIRKLFKEVPAKTPTGNVALNIAFDREERRYGKDEEKILTQIAYFAKEISRRGYKLFIVYHCYNDRKFKPYLDNIGVKYQEKDLSELSPNDVFLFYNCIDLVCGMRGHAQMIPFGLNCEIISLGTHDKMRWFLEDINSKDWYIDLRDTPDSICERLLSMFCRIHETEREKTRQRLLYNQDRLMDITEQNMQYICSLLNE